LFSPEVTRLLSANQLLSLLSRRITEQGGSIGAGGPVEFDVLFDAANG